MTQIHLGMVDQNHVTVQFSFVTGQQFFYNIAVVSPGNVQIYHSTGQSTGTTFFDLGPASGLIGNYLIIYWSVIDAGGAGNSISANAIASQTGIACKDYQVCAGTSTVNPLPVVTVGQFVNP